ncbi:TetR/AcrR family transcriptional regulator [Dongia sp.]|uniref:TetR/AcrR family transcriptional regulator n=1 Tax=Dongia sp. TaxID=1977262 RepID=UPI0035B1AA4A
MSTRIAKSKSVMRKAPSQSRSRATVAAIVEAATRILAAQGWAAFTTNKVAEAAGVSIGSLYQYFPDKLSLIEAIRKQHLDDCLAVLRRAAAGGKTQSQLLEDLVGSIIAIHSIHPGLHRVLLDEAPSAETFRNPQDAFEQEYLACYRTWVAAFRGGKARASDEAIAIVLSDAIDGIVHNAARRGTLQSAAVKTELMRLVRGYLESE